MPYDILLFDADGTLLDFNRAEETAFRAVFKAHGYSYLPESLAQYREINDRLWREYELKIVTQQSIQTRRFEALFGRLGLLGDAARFNSEYLELLGRCAFLNEGAEALCREMLRRGKKLCLATNAIASVQRARIGASPLKELFSELFISQEIGASKPQREYFERVLERLNHPDPARVLMIGDSLTADIGGGNAAGLDTVWYNPARLPNESSRPTHEIHALAELAELVV